MKNVKFGVNQFFTRSPAIIANFKKAVNAFGAGLVTFAPQLSEAIGVKLEHFNLWMGISLLFVNTFGNMFGSTQPAPAPPAEQP